MEIIHTNIGGYMKENSHGKPNPVKKEIEVKGLVSFVKTYFKKLQKMIFGPAKGKVKKTPKAKKAAPAQNAEKKAKVVKSPHVNKSQKHPKL
jgi:hypothetical protein